MQQLTERRLRLAQHFAGFARIAWELMGLHILAAPMQLEGTVQELHADLWTLDLARPRPGWLCFGPTAVCGGTKGKGPQ